MATAILSYFSVIFRDRAKRKWIIPFLLESETYPKIELSKFQAEYLKARTKYNRVFLFNQLPCSFFSRLYVSVLHRYKQAKIKAWQSEQVFISYHLSHFVTRFAFLSGSISLLLINQSGILLYFNNSNEKLSILSDAKNMVIHYSSKYISKIKFFFSNFTAMILIIFVLLMIFQSCD